MVIYNYCETIFKNGKFTILTIEGE